MELTKLSISYGRTENLGNFSNVRPEVTLEAVLHAGDTLEAAREVLLREARAIVEAEIDDALEKVDVPARYDATSPRFWVFATKPKHWEGPTYQPLPGTMAIVPASVARLGNDWYQVSIGDQRKQPVRLRHARAVTQRYANENEGYTELRDVLERWWETGRSDELVQLCPIAGDSIIDLMVDGAIQPVLATADLANYLKESGLPVDDL